MSFDDLINERIDKAREISESKPSIEAQIQNETIKIGEYIKASILSLAGKTFSEKFRYSGLLCFSDLPYSKSNYECGLLDFNFSTNTYKHFLSPDTVIEREVYSLNNNAEIFFTSLRKCLADTGIRIGWKVCLLKYNSDYNGRPDISPPRLDIISSRCVFLLDLQSQLLDQHSLWGKMFHYTKPVECITTSDKIQYPKFRSWEWNYSNEKFTYQPHPSFYLCLSVDYEPRSTGR